MDEWLAKATQGVDLDAPEATWRIAFNLLHLMPWGALFWWSVAFVVIGALAGWRRGRLATGIVWALILGPFGCLVVLWMPRRPPLLPPGR